MDLTDEQWEVLEPLISEPPRRADGRGRPWRDARDVLNGILWIFTLAPLGTTYPIAILPTRPAIGVFSGGSRRACSQASLRSWPRTWRSMEAWTSRGVLHRRYLRGGQKRGTIGTRAARLHRHPAQGFTQVFVG
jgi:transposase